MSTEKTSFLPLCVKVHVRKLRTVRKKWWEGKRRREEGGRRMMNNSNPGDFILLVSIFEHEKEETSVEFRILRY